MPPNPALRDRAKPPTQAKRQPVKPVQTALRQPPPPDPNINPTRTVQLPRWRSTDGRLRIEDRGYELVAFSDGRMAGSLTVDDCETLIGALVLSVLARGAKRGTLTGSVVTGGVHITFGPLNGRTEHDQPQPIEVIP